MSIWGGSTGGHKWEGTHRFGTGDSWLDLRSIEAAIVQKRESCAKPKGGAWSRRVSEEIEEGEGGRAQANVQAIGRKKARIRALTCDALATSPSLAAA